MTTFPTGPAPATPLDGEESVFDAESVKSALAVLGINNVEAYFAQGTAFLELLETANRRINLTRVTSTAGFWHRHVLDSLRLLGALDALANTVPERALKVIDVGSGAGFPAIPLALARPDWDIVALEATGKKCRFIEEARDALGLTRLTVVNARAEDAARAPESREAFDAALSRAVAQLPVLLEWVSPLVRPNGILLCMKGREYVAEMAAAANAAKTLRLSKGEVVPAVSVLADYPTEGAVLRYVKTAATPEKFPRRAGMAAKKPL